MSDTKTIIITHMTYWVYMILIFTFGDLRDGHEENVRPERGFRMIQTFSAKDMGCGTQNFSIVQGQTGTIYVGNLHGVAGYNGAEWDLTALPNHSAVQVLGVTQSGTILLGGYGELGLLERDAYNQSRYKSLKSNLVVDLQDFGDVKRIYVLDDQTYIHTERFLFQYENRQLSCLADLGENAWESSFFVHDGQLYRQTLSEITPVDKGKKLFAQAPPSPVLFSLGNGAFLLNGGGVFVEEGATPPAPFLISWLRGSRISSVCPLPGDRIAIGTRDKGILILDSAGQPSEIIDTLTGLPINDVRGLSVTGDGALWVALNVGIAKVDISSQVSVFDKKSGIEGGINCLIRHEGRLFFGTSSGLFFMQSVPRDTTNNSTGLYLSHAKRITGPTTTVWSLLIRENGELLVGTSKGLFILRNNELEIIPGTSNFVIYCIKQAHTDSDVYYVGGHSGLGLLMNKEHSWLFKGLIPGLPAQVRCIEETPNQDIWIGTTFEGAWRIRGMNFHGNTSDELELKKVGSGEYDLFWFNSRLCFSSGEHSFLFNESKGELIPHPLVGVSVIKESYFGAQEDFFGRLWIGTHPITRVTIQQGSSPLLDNYSFRNLPGQDFQIFYPEEDGTMWLASEIGLVKIEETTTEVPPTTFRPEISRVVYRQKLVRINDHQTATVLPYSKERMRIEFAPLNYEANNLFQYRLEPNEKEWSEWSRLAFTEYTNLWESSYTFRMRMKSKGGGVTPEATFRFRVQPPWYRTLWAFTGYILLFTMSLVAFIKWRYVILRKHARLLEKRVLEQTAQLNSTLGELKEAKHQVEENNERLKEANQLLENMSFEDGLTGLANRRHLDHFTEKEWSRASRLKIPTSVILLDIDYFKKYNDHFGHLDGDKCLKRLAQYLSDLSLRGNDLVARYGGEEFTIVLSNCSLENAEELAEEVREGIENLNIPHPKSPFGKVTSSLGVSSMLANQNNQPDQLLKQADEALYNAKALGRNRVSSVRP